MSEKADDNATVKQQKKPTLDISHIEKSIDDILKEKAQKTPTQPPQDQKTVPIPPKIYQTSTTHPPETKKEYTMENLIKPKYHLTPEEKKKAALERIPLLDKEPLTPNNKEITPISQEAEPTPDPIASETTKLPQQIPASSKETIYRSPTEQNLPQKPPTTTTTPPDKQPPQTYEFTHPQDYQTQPPLDTNAFTPTANNRPSIYAVKKKIPEKIKKSPPHLPTFFKPFQKTLTNIKTKTSTFTLPHPFTKTPLTTQKTTQPANKHNFFKQLTQKPLLNKKTDTHPTPDQSTTKHKKPILSSLKLPKPRMQLFAKKPTTPPTTPVPQPLEQSTQKPQIHPELNESLQQLSAEETNWLDQKIQETKLPTTSSQDPLQPIQTPSTSQTHKKDNLLKPHFLQGLKRHRKQTSQQSKADFFNINQNQTAPPSLQTIPANDKTKSFSTLFQKNQKPKSTIPFTFQDQQQKTFKELFVKPKESEKLNEHIFETSPELSLPESKPQKSKIQDINQLKTLLLEDLGYKEGTCEELDFYPLMEPFSYVEILREKKTLDKRYILIEIDLTDQEREILTFIRESLNNITVDAKDLEIKGDREYLKAQVEQIIEDYMLKLDDAVKKKIIFYIEKQFLGLEKLEVLMRDPNIEDISCDGSRVPIFLFHRKYGSLRSNVEFETEEGLASFVIKLAQKCGKHISIAEPMLDATMPDGSRIQMTLSTEITTKGSTFTIRKFMEDPFSPPDLIEFNTMSSEMVAYMWMAVENGINALIAGGTASGKTSALNALALFIPRESKIVSIEETREINLPHPNWIPGVSRSGFGEVVGNKVMGEIDLYDLMKAALRQRPEYILVGEIRGQEAYVLFQAMATGHTTYSTVHADSAQSLIHRLEGKPINIPRIMLQALDIVCIQVISRVKNKRARRCKQIIEIIDIDPTTKEILTNEVFHWDPIEDKFVYSGKSYVLERIRAEKDLTRDQMTKELHDRSRILEWMNEQNVREFKEVATLIAQYVDNPSAIMKKIG